jgi:hypothetical protein
LASRCLGVLALVGDLLAEVVALPEFLAHDLDDVVGMAVALGEDQRLGQLGAVGEDLRFHRPLEGRITVRIWLGFTTSRSSCVPV